MNDQFIIFNESYTIKNKIPCFVQMKTIDRKMPPNNIIDQGSKVIRSYWNNKNLRKRGVKD